jgi:ribosomal RNA-processing protein 36
MAPAKRSAHFAPLKYATVIDARLGRDDSDSESDDGAGPTFGERLATRQAKSAAEATYASAPRRFGEGNSHGSGAPVAKRDRKDRPREVSSKKPVPVGRARCLGIVPQASGAGTGGVGKAFDPRFEEHCGPLHEDMLKTHYGFINDMRAKERDEVRDQLRKEPTNDTLRSQLRSMEAEEARRRAEERRDEIRRELKKEEREKVKLGKKPFFVKESAVRERELEQKFNDLKATGGVQKFIEKRRKRHASKDRRLLPNLRPDE